MKCKHASLVINPRAGENLAKLSDVLAILAAAGWSTELTLKEYGGQTMDLAAKAAEKGSDLVIAYDGDGTLNQVVNGVMHARGQHSIVGLIPGWTANVWAGEISVPGDPVKAALTLVDSDVRKVDIGHVEVEGVAFPDAPQDEQQQHSKQSERERQEALEHVKALLEHGRKVTVVGVSPNPAKKDTYIVAGSATKQSTGEARPVAVCIDKSTTVMRQTGEDVSPAVVPKLHESETIVAEGKKSKESLKNKFLLLSELECV